VETAWLRFPHGLCARPVKIHQEHLEIRTPGKGLVNITERLRSVVTVSGIQTGLLTVFVCHTSASLLIQENADPAVLRDLERFFGELVPESRRWEHDDEGPDDMPAHVRAALTQTSQVIPITNGHLVLGTWQGVYLWEHRFRSHTRRLVAHVQGTS
jgi:secondary thiamine-phosphate synthase enzyme